MVLLWVCCFGLIDDFWFVFAYGFAILWVCVVFGAVHLISGGFVVVFGFDCFLVFGCFDSCIFARRLLRCWLIVICVGGCLFSVLVSWLLLLFVGYLFVFCLIDFYLFCFLVYAYLCFLGLFVLEFDVCLFGSGPIVGLGCLVLLLVFCFVVCFIAICVDFWFVFDLIALVV